MKNTVLIWYCIVLELISGTCAHVLPSHPRWSPRSLSSCRWDTPPSPAWRPRTPRPAAADACTQASTLTSGFCITKPQCCLFCFRRWDFLRVGSCARVFTCFYQRPSSEPQTWFLPPPWETSSSSSCWRIRLKNLNQKQSERLHHFERWRDKNMLK